LDNRPLQAPEFDAMTGQTVYVSATPKETEIDRSAVVAEQLIRPTGLLDPVMEVRPLKGQVEDLIGEIKAAAEKGERVLVTTLTKRMTEDLSSFVREAGVKVEYLHSDIDAIERVEILRNLRAGKFDVLIGVNLLREGLDLPEVALVAILDADKEGFLRSETSLIQTAGRAARHEDGRVIFYADVMTKALKKTLEVSAYRRSKQEAHNKKNGIVPKGVKRMDQLSLQYEQVEEPKANTVGEIGIDEDVSIVIKELEQEMFEAAANLEFEKAALLRDQVESLKSGEYLKKPKGDNKYRKGAHRYKKRK
jgi:excinuclease ABC subunit B